MSTSIDHDELEAYGISLGDRLHHELNGHDLGYLDEREIIDRGGRAVRRRRIAGGAGMLAAVVALGAGTAGLSGHLSANSRSTTPAGGATAVTRSSEPAARAATPVAVRLESLGDFTVNGKTYNAGVGDMIARWTPGAGGHSRGTITITTKETKPRVLALVDLDAIAPNGAAWAPSQVGSLGFEITPTSARDTIQISAQSSSPRSSGTSLTDDGSWGGEPMKITGTGWTVQASGFSRPDGARRVKNVLWSDGTTVRTKDGASLPSVTLPGTPDYLAFVDEADGQFGIIGDGQFDLAYLTKGASGTGGVISGGSSTGRSAEVRSEYALLVPSGSTDPAVVLSSGEKLPSAPSGAASAPAQAVRVTAAPVIVPVPGSSWSVLFTSYASPKRREVFEPYVASASWTDAAGKRRTYRDPYERAR